MDGAELTVTDSCWVAVPPTPSVTTRVKVEVPDVVGTPEIRPVDGWRVRPPGSVPPVTDHVYGPWPPVAVAVWL